MPVYDKNNISQQKYMIVNNNKNVYQPKFFYEKIESLVSVTKITWLTLRTRLNVKVISPLLRQNGGHEMKNANNSI